MSIALIMLGIFASVSYFHIINNMKMLDERIKKLEESARLEALRALREKR